MHPDRPQELHPDRPRDFNEDETEAVSGYDKFRSALLANYRYCYQNDKLRWLVPAAIVRPRVPLGYDANV